MWRSWGRVQQRAQPRWWWFSGSFTARADHHSQAKEGRDTFEGRHALERLNKLRLNCCPAVAGAADGIHPSLHEKELMTVNYLLHIGPFGLSRPPYSADKILSPGASAQALLLSTVAHHSYVGRYQTLRCWEREFCSTPQAFQPR